MTDSRNSLDSKHNNSLADLKQEIYTQDIDLHWELNEKASMLRSQALPNADEVLAGMVAKSRLSEGLFTVDSAQRIAINLQKMETALPASMGSAADYIASPAFESLVTRYVRRLHPTIGQTYTGGSEALVAIGQMKQRDAEQGLASLKKNPYILVIDHRDKDHLQHQVRVEIKRYKNLMAEKENFPLASIQFVHETFSQLTYTLDLRSAKHQALARLLKKFEALQLPESKAIEDAGMTDDERNAYRDAYTLTQVIATLKDIVEVDAHDWDSDNATDKISELAARLILTVSPIKNTELRDLVAHDFFPYSDGSRVQFYKTNISKISAILEKNLNKLEKNWHRLNAQADNNPLSEVYRHLYILTEDHIKRYQRLGPIYLHGLQTRLAEELNTAANNPNEEHNEEKFDWQQGQGDTLICQPLEHANDIISLISITYAQVAQLAADRGRHAAQSLMYEEDANMRSSAITEEKYAAGSQSRPRGSLLTTVTPSNLAFRVNESFSFIPDPKKNLQENLRALLDKINLSKPLNLNDSDKNIFEQLFSEADAALKERERSNEDDDQARRFLISKISWLATLLKHTSTRIENKKLAAFALAFREYAGADPDLMRLYAKNLEEIDQALQAKHIELQESKLTDINQAIEDYQNSGVFYLSALLTAVQKSSATNLVQIYNEIEQLTKPFELLSRLLRKFKKFSKQSANNNDEKLDKFARNTLNQTILTLQDIIQASHENAGSAHYRIAQLVASLTHQSAYSTYIENEQMKDLIAQLKMYADPTRVRFYQKNLARLDSFLEDRPITLDIPESELDISIITARSAARNAILEYQTSGPISLPKLQEALVELNEKIPEQVPMDPGLQLVHDTFAQVDYLANSIDSRKHLHEALSSLHVEMMRSNVSASRLADALAKAESEKAEAESKGVQEDVVAAQQKITALKRDSHSLNFMLSLLTGLTQYGPETWGEDDYHQAIAQLSRTAAIMQVSPIENAYLKNFADKLCGYAHPHLVEKCKPAMEKISTALEAQRDKLEKLIKETLSSLPSSTQEDSMKKDSLFALCKTVISEIDDYKTLGPIYLPEMQNGMIHALRMASVQPEGAQYLSLYEHRKPNRRDRADIHSSSASSIIRNIFPEYTILPSNQRDEHNVLLVSLNPPGGNPENIKESMAIQFLRAGLFPVQGLLSIRKIDGQDFIAIDLNKINDALAKPLEDEGYLTNVTVRHAQDFQALGEKTWITNDSDMYQADITFPDEDDAISQIKAMEIRNIAIGLLSKSNTFSSSGEVYSLSEKISPYHVKPVSVSESREEYQVHIDLDTYRRLLAPITNLPLAIMKDVHDTLLEIEQLATQPLDLHAATKGSASVARVSADSPISADSSVDQSTSSARSGRTARAQSSPPTFNYATTESELSSEEEATDSASTDSELKNSSDAPVVPLRELPNTQKNPSPTVDADLPKHKFNNNPAAVASLRKLSITQKNPSSSVDVDISKKALVWLEIQTDAIEADHHPSVTSRLFQKKTFSLVKEVKKVLNSQKTVKDQLHDITDLYIRRAIQFFKDYPAKADAELAEKGKHDGARLAIGVLLKFFFLIRDQNEKTPLGEIAELIRNQNIQNKFASIDLTRSDYAYKNIKSCINLTFDEAFSQRNTRLLKT